MPIEFLSKLTNHNIEDIALQSIWNAKASQMICAKGVKFKQYAYSKPTPPNYYTMLFLPSGCGKNLVVDLINDYLLPFLKPEMDSKIKDWKNNYFELNCQPSGDKKADREKEKIVSDYLKSIEDFHIDIASATFTGVYKVANQINETGYGAINILITEFGDFIDSITSGDMSKKELFESLKDMSDGKVMPKVIAGDCRKNLMNIPITAILASDFENLFDTKNNKYYTKMLKTGMSRRSFIYITSDGKKNKNIPVKEREKAQLMGLALGEHYKNVYDSIPENGVYEFSEKAKQLLEDWHNDCIDDFNSLVNIDSLLAAEKESSFWKITKLAVVYSVIDSPTTMVIDSSYVEQAINFYKQIQPCLEVLISKRPDPPEELLKKYLTKQKNGAIIKLGDLRAQKFVSSNEFAKWIDGAIDELQLQDWLFPWEGRGRARGWQVRK